MGGYEVWEVMGYGRQQGMAGRKVWQHTDMAGNEVWEAMMYCST